MKPIKILDTSTINKIAAGEVVERPASVVKELLENSIDAGASAITIEINDGGISKIRVTDNGSGIESDQVALAFMNHATSKIQNVEDIFSISSLGFRGEALASIASVSQLEIITKTYYSIMGKRMEVEAGEIKQDENIGCPNGTTIIVKNLFFNTPARHKFLKKPATETSYISDIVNKISLANPNISFKFISNGKTLLSTSGDNKLLNVIIGVYGKEFVSKLVDIDFNKYDYKLSGLIGKPELSRASRSNQNIFINKRFVKNDLIKEAVEDAYKTRIMTGKFPVYTLNLEIPPNKYDVNVHPAKLEVRFDSENEIYDLVYIGVCETLKSQDLVPKVTSKKVSKNKVYIEAKQQNLFEPLETENSNLNMLNTTNKIKQENDFILKEETIPFAKETKTSNINLNTNTLNKVTEIIKDKAIEKKDTKVLINYKIIGRVFGTYWILEQNDSVFLIDQHAAHERILYERFINLYNSKNFSSQMLLQPIVTKLTPKETQILVDNLKLFDTIGFKIEKFGDKDYIIRAVPVIFDNPENVTFFNDILDELEAKVSNSPLEIKFDKIASISCKAAVKANTKLSDIEAKKLIDDLMNLKNPFSCPHGRPTIIEISKYEIEKKFKRIL